MNFRPTGNGASGKQSASGNDDLSEREAELLANFAQEYFATDFPNPGREGCPSPTALRTLAQSGELPHDELCDHLFGCSECFRAYRTALEAGRAAAHAGATVKRRREWRSRLAPAFALKPAFVLAVILPAVSVAVWLAWRDSAIPATPQTVQIQPRPSATIPSPANEERLSRNEAPGMGAENKTSSSTRANRPSVSFLVVKADLDELVAMRGVTASGAESKAIALRQARVRLELTLPENSRPGVYRASIVNAAGGSLRTQRASSADGVNLGLEFDLRKVTAGSYYLRLARQGAMPVSYPVRLTTGD